MKHSVDLADSKYPFFVRKATSGAGYIFEVSDLPGCCGFSLTDEGVVKAAHKAIELWLESAAELGLEIPRPGAKNIATTLSVRVPRTLHSKLSDTAKVLEISLNELVVRLLSNGVSKRMSKLTDILAAYESCTFIGNPSILARKPYAPTDVDRKLTGAWTQRLPKLLHQQVRKLATMEGVSLNQLIAVILSEEMAMFGLYGVVGANPKRLK